MRNDSVVLGQYRCEKNHLRGVGVASSFSSRHRECAPQVGQGPWTCRTGAKTARVQRSQSFVVQRVRLPRRRFSFQLQSSHRRLQPLEI